MEEGGSMTLEEMGALLRQERERQGVSLDTAAADIKISKRYLIALEEGRTDMLPHPVYAKGFVKNYAKLLGLDPEELGETLARHYAVDDDQLQHPPGQGIRSASVAPKERGAPYRISSGFRPSRWMAVPVLALFGALLWYFFSSSMGEGGSLEKLMGYLKPSSATTQSAQQAAEKPKQPQAPAPVAAKPEPKPEPKAEPQPEPGTVVQRDLLATTPGAGGAKAGSAPQAGSTGQEPELTAEKLAAEAKFAVSGKQIVEINATQPATLEVTAEDGQKRVFTLLKGQRLNVRFNDKVSVRFAQAPGVSIKLNGREYAVEGGKADGKSINFP